METVIEIQHLKKHFGSLEVLNDINFSVQKGEVVTVIGSSGSGKSTMLRCINMLETPSGGNILFHGKDISAKGADVNQYRSRVGMVFQNFNLFPHYTVLKNITDAPLSVQKRPKDQVMAQAHELLVKMGLEGKENMVPCELSGGQQQRVAIARALALNPDVLFFDEPTSALDPELTKGVLKVIRDLADEHMTMVIVTHEMSFARDVADHIIFMDGGYIVEEGPAEQVINNPQQERTKLFLANYGD